MPVVPSKCPSSSDVVVIGGGLSGLCAAHAIQRSDSGRTVTLLEATGAVGGNLRRVQVDGSFTDVGAQTVNGLTPDLVELLDRLGLADRVVRSAEPVVRICVNGRLRPLPRWSEDGPLVRDLLRLGYVSAPALARTAAALIHTGLSRGEGMKRGGFLDALRSAARERAEGSLLSPLRESSYDPALRKGRRREREAWGLKGGTAQLAERLGQELTPVIRTGRPVARIVRAGDGWAVLDAAGAELHRASSVVCATPAPVTGRMLAEQPAADVLADIPYRSSATATFLFADRTDVMDSAVTGILIGDPALAPLVAVSFLGRKFDHAGTSGNLVRCSLRLDPSLPTTPEDVCRLAEGLLRGVLGGLPPVIDRRGAVFGHGVPAPRPSDAARLQEGQKELRRRGVHLAGAYLGRPSGLRAAILSGFRAGSEAIAGA